MVGRFVCRSASFLIQAHNKHVFVAIVMIKTGLNYIGFKLFFLSDRQILSFLRKIRGLKHTLHVFHINIDFSDLAWNDNEGNVDRESFA